MRTRWFIVSGALLLASSGVALGQHLTPVTPLPTSPTLGQVNFGFRTDSIHGDEARSNRFRDLRQGAFLDAFRFERETPAWFFTAAASNVGYRDQRYTARTGRIGRLEAGFEWDQVPLFISRDTRTLYTDQGNGVLAIEDGVQMGLQSGALTLDTVMAQAAPYELRGRRDNGAFDLVYRVTRDVDLRFNVKNSARSGANLMSFGFGTSPGLNPVVEFAAPTDDRTTDVRGALEFANARGRLSVGYDGSWYENSLPAVRFDNPLRYTDASAGASVGQAAMWPSNLSANVNVTGSYKLPARSRAGAAISVGRWSQDETLLPATVNSALAPPPLARGTAEARANILSMLYSFSSRPLRSLSLNAKYRYYDYDNRTEHFDTVALVGDWALGTAVWENEPGSITRKTVDVDAAFTPVDFLSFGAGYSHDDADRTWRIYESTAEDVVRLSVDTRGNSFVTVGLHYEMSTRDGAGFDPHLLAEVAEQPGTRHYDVAIRDRSRLRGLLTVTPLPLLAVSASVGTVSDEYDETEFGLRDSDSTTWSVGVDVVPSDTVNVGVSYGYDKYTGLQYSRTSNPPPSPMFDDPTRDWWLDQHDTVKTFSASLVLLNAVPKTNVRVGYDLSDAKSSYLYSLKPEQTVFTTTPLAQIAPMDNLLGIGSFDVEYFVRPNVAVGVAYWFEDYAVEDFTQNDTTINKLNLPSSIYSGYLLRDFTSHTAWMRLTYLW